MSKTYRAWNPRQSWLLPPSPQDWLPQGDLVYFLMDVVESTLENWMQLKINRDGGIAGGLGTGLR